MTLACSIPHRIVAAVFALAVGTITHATPAAPAVPSAAAPTARETLLARALANPVPVWRRGDLLVDRLNRGVYTYGPDEPGVSVCDLNCRRYWPPVYAAPGAQPIGPFTLATGPEGRAIWAWQGQPLYRWTGDVSRGSARGEVVAEWFLVRVPRELQPQVVAYFPMPAVVPAPAR